MNARAIVLVPFEATFTYGLSCGTAINRFAFWNLPLVSGFALRVLPVPFIERRLAEFNLEVGPAVVHLHPWELDSEGPEPPSVSRPIRALKRVGRTGLARKLDRLLAAHAFASIAEVFPVVAPGAAMTTGEVAPTVKGKASITLSVTVAGA